MIDDRMLEEILNDSDSPSSFTGVGFLAQLRNLNPGIDVGTQRGLGGEGLGLTRKDIHQRCELCNALTVGCQSGLRWRQRNPSELSGSCRGCRRSPTAASEPAGCSVRKDKRARERRDEVMLRISCCDTKHHKKYY